MTPHPPDSVLAQDQATGAAAVLAVAETRIAVDARGLALGIVAVIASVFALSWAQAFVIPLLLGVVVSYTLNPLVAFLEGMRIPRVFGTLAVMAGVIAALLLGAYSLRGQAQAIIEQLPEASIKLSSGLARLQGSKSGNLQKVQSAATEMERATTMAAAAGTAPRQPATHVIVDQPTFKLGSYLWGNTMGALGALGQASMVAFLVFFLLLGGDTFKRKLVRLAGPTLSRRKITVNILDDINGSIQKYMFMLLTTNLLVGLGSWIAFRWIGLENAGAWAAAAGVLHLVPYLGPAFTAVAVAMAAFIQFDSPALALLAGGASLAIATFVGMVVTTWMVGRIAHMNSAAVFISLLFWGWLWGVWGMLLAIPIIVIINVVSQHVAQLHPLAEILGE